METSGTYEVALRITELEREVAAEGWAPSFAAECVECPHHLPEDAGSIAAEGG